MKLSDVMSAMGLGTYAEIALVLFMAAFVAIAAHVFARRNAAEWERASRLPLDSSPEPPLSAGSPSTRAEQEPS